jgi:hypothetical protein
MLYAALSRRDECFASLDRAVDDRSAEVESLLHDPMFDSIRADPRFEEILGKIGIPLRNDGKVDAGV